MSTSRYLPSHPTSPVTSVKADTETAPTTVDPPSPAQTALDVARDAPRWRQYLDFDPDRRYYRRLVADEHHEVWLLTWLPGQGTDWHDHGLSSGAFVVVQGALVERSARYGIVLGSPALRDTGDAHAFGSEYVHKVTNEGPDPAVSIHVYTPRLEVQHDYVSNDGVLRRVATRRLGVDW